MPVMDSTSLSDLEIDEAGQAVTARNLVSAFIAESATDRPSRWQSNPRDYAAGNTILDAGVTLQVFVFEELVQAIITEQDEYGVWSSYLDTTTLLRRLCASIFRKPGPSESQLVRVINTLAAVPTRFSDVINMMTFAKRIERWMDSRPGPPGVLQALDNLIRTEFLQSDYYGNPEIRVRFQLLIDGQRSAPPEILLDDDCGTAANSALGAMDADLAGRWSDILAHAATADNPSPTPTWLRNARKLIDNLGTERFASSASEWLLFMTKPHSGLIRDYRYHVPIPTSLIVDKNGTLIKGIAWMASLADPAMVARPLGDTAIACYTRIPQVGPRCLKAGNACVYALSALPGLESATQLVRLQQRVIYSQPRGKIGAALSVAAARAGLTVDQIADLAVPDFGLADGPMCFSVGAHTGQIAIDSRSGASLSWHDATGAVCKALPAATKREHATDIALVKRRAKDVDATLHAQRLRIERFPVAKRVWTYEEWRRLLFDHALLSSLTRRLIWTFTDGDEVRHGTWLNGEIVGADNQPLPELSGASVALFHPVLADASTTLQWQLWLERHQIMQPFKQAHREIYRVTDAELNAVDQSARFAGHILQQHQFAALCKARGWTYRLQGAFDGYNVPMSPLIGGFRAEFVVDPMHDEEFLTDMGIDLYVESKHVTFKRQSGANSANIPLADVPPVIFSELLRDIDLFVSVPNAGSDPNWAYREYEQYSGYWSRFAFGSLSEAAKGRKALLARLLSGLAIASKCEITDRFLIVRGSLRTYRIHLGSGNIMMDPNNEYLCIVKKHVSKEEAAVQGVYLPFEGDPTLSLILSKAFLLANDSKIKDPTILRQIVSN